VLPAISNIAINLVFISLSLLTRKKANCVPMSKLLKIRWMKVYKWLEGTSLAVEIGR
jgi:hypothetical protein